MLPFCEEAASTREDMPRLWSSLPLAKEMGALLGRGPLLLGAVQAVGAPAPLIWRTRGQAGRFLCRLARKRLRRLCWFIFNRRFFFRLPMDDSCQVRLSGKTGNTAASLAAGKSIPGSAWASIHLRSGLAAGETTGSAPSSGTCTDWRW